MPSFKLTPNSPQYALSNFSYNIKIRIRWLAKIGNINIFNVHLNYIYDIKKFMVLYY